MNKKGITPIIAVVLLLMMTVAAAGAAFYWLTRMQQQAQSGVQGQQQQIVEEASASLALVSQNYNTGSASDQNISVDIQNTGGRSISIAADDIIMVLEDGDGDAVCTSGALSSSQFVGYDCCAAGATIAPNNVARIKVKIDDTNCADLTDGDTYYYQFKFRKGTSISGSFTA